MMFFMANLRINLSRDKHFSEAKLPLHHQSSGTQAAHAVSCLTI
jgi:hypothetical protein